MLNKFIRNPMAAATADRYSGVARFKMATWVSSLEACPNISEKASIGFDPNNRSAIDETINVRTKAPNGAAVANAIRRSTSRLLRRFELPRRSYRRPGLGG